MEIKDWIITGVVALFLLNTASAQLGINVGYYNNDHKTWNEVLNNFDQNNSEEIFATSYKVGLDYGFDMALYRISFFPELYYKWSDKTEFSTSQLRAYEFSLSQIGFAFKTQIYPLDLLSKKSMQCPSFHRGSDIFIKGWYLLVSPELLYSMKVGRLVLGGDDPAFLNFDHSSLIFNFGIGTGIDIGISKAISISPHLIYLFSIGENWEGFSESAFQQPSYNDATGVSQLAAGLRIGFWF